MPLSIEHEAPIELCQRHPELVPKLLRLCGQHLPPGVVAEHVPATFHQTLVPEWEGDGAAVLKLSEQTVAAVVIEIQRGIDPKKRLSWPMYTSALHSRCGGVDTYLLCIATNRPTAAWARQPIRSMQPHAPFVPLVIGPDDLPRLPSLEVALADLPMAMLSALLHVSDADGEVEAGHTLQALQRQASRDMLIWFCGLLRGIVDGQKLQRLEEIIKMLDPWVNYVPRTEWEKEHYNRGLNVGEARGEAKALLYILDARGLTLTDDQRRQIMACSDVTVLERWIRRALAARSTADVFADNGQR